MRSVELAPGVRSSVLGFGCASVLGAVDGATARRAIDTALDLGITHFDLARSYGFGEAESFVGACLRSSRSRVVLATKFGIEATRLARLLRPVKPLVRALRALRDGSNPAPKGSGSRRQAETLGRLLRRVPHDPLTMRSSLERSLRELRTDFVDLLLMHEPPHSGLPRMGELVEMADRLKREGKIRAWGIASYWPFGPALRDAIECVDVVQCDLSPSAVHYQEVRAARRHASNVFFSAFRGRAVGESPADVIAKLTGDFPHSVILCSTFSPEHLIENVRAADAVGS